MTSNRRSLSVQILFIRHRAEWWNSILDFGQKHKRLFTTKGRKGSKMAQKGKLISQISFSNDRQSVCLVEKSVSRMRLSSSVTRLGDLLDFGNFSKHLATINLPKSPTFLGNFCNGVKIFNFSCEIIFGQLLKKFGNFCWSHCFPVSNKVEDGKCLNKHRTRPSYLVAFIWSPCS